MNKINVRMDPSIPTKQQICHFAEGLYSQMIKNISNQSSIFCLLIDDDAILPEYPRLTTANLRNVLLGGKSTGKATVDEFVQARVEYDSPIRSLSQSPFRQDNPFLVHTSKTRKTDQKRIHFSSAISMNKTHLINHLVLSTSTIINRIFGIRRKQTVQLVKLQLSIQRRIALLRACANICHVVSNTDATYITENIAKRAYQRVIQDPFGAFRPSIEIEIYTKKFPACMEKAANSYGYIDEWANKCSFNATSCFDNVDDRKVKRTKKIRVLFEKKPFLALCKNTLLLFT
jgi:hypothetical protein